MKVAIIDDLPICRNEIKQYLSHYHNEHFSGDQMIFEEYDNGEAFLSNYSPNHFDLIFIDQYMEGLSGIETAHKIRELDTIVALIFVTTSREHAIDSYGVRACGYLVKPYTYEEFKKTMQLACIQKLRNARCISIQNEKIPLHMILWCDKDQHYVQIHTDKDILLRFRLSFLELSNLLAPYPQFIHCYKGCIINLDRVLCIEENNFITDNHRKVFFSSRDKKKIKAQYHSYLFQKERANVLL